MRILRCREIHSVPLRRIPDPDSALLVLCSHELLGDCGCSLLRFDDKTHVLHRNCLLRSKPSYSALNACRAIKPCCLQTPKRVSVHPVSNESALKTLELR